MREVEDAEVIVTDSWRGGALEGKLSDYRM